MEREQIVSSKRTKIVATLGPASGNRETLKEMILAGMNAARLNFSHGSHEDHAQMIALVREVAAELNIPIAIIGDLRGPHIRVGDMQDGCVTLQEGQTFCLVPDECLGTTERATVSFPKLARDVQKGTWLLLDDGSIHMEVNKIHSDGRIEGIITQAGTLSSRRGINVPGVRLSLPPLTQKDLADIDFAIAQNLDFLALSFVQSANDVQTLKTILAAKNSDQQVIAKIEMSSAIDNIEDIVDEADAVMVARGDMALEMSFKEIPVAQKRIISICRQHGVPVITATQMLESMITSKKPTRAEVTDVANAVFDGTDALMLSGETAIGKYPAFTVGTMSRIAKRAEQAWANKEVPRLPDIAPNPAVNDIISYTSATASQYLNAAAIISYTRTGGTARRISRFRPSSPILVLTPFPKTHNQLAITWGVTSVLIENIENTDEMTQFAIDHAKELDMAHPGDHVIITSGNPKGPPGNTNLITIERIGDDA